MALRGEDSGIHGGGPLLKLTSSFSLIMDLQGLGDKGLEREQKRAAGVTGG